MYYRVTRIAKGSVVAGTRRSQKTLDSQDTEELVGYVYAADYREALQIVVEEYGERLRVARIDCWPDDDVWPPGSEDWQPKRKHSDEEAFLEFDDDEYD